MGCMVAMGAFVLAGRRTGLLGAHAVLPHRIPAGTGCCLSAYLAEIDLYSAVMPFAAFLALLHIQFDRRAIQRKDFGTLAAMTVLFFVLLAGAYGRNREPTRTFSTATSSTSSRCS